MAFAQTKLKFSYRLHAGYVFNAHSKKMPISFLLMINSAKKIKPYILKTSFFLPLRGLKQFDTVLWKKRNMGKQRWDDSTNKDKTYKAIICKYGVSSHSWGVKRIIFRETTPKSAQQITLYWKETSTGYEKLRGLIQVNLTARQTHQYRVLNFNILAFPQWRKLWMTTLANLAFSFFLAQ